MAAIAGLAAIAIYFYQFPSVDNRTAFTVYTSAYSLNFLLGMASFWLYKRGGRGLIDFVMGCLILLGASITMPLPYKLSAIAFGIGFALTLSGAAKMERHYKFSCPKVLTVIGDASYTIYLIHLALEGLFLKIEIKSGFYAHAGPAASFFATMILTLAAGCCAYYLVERPLLSWLQARGKGRRKLTPLPAGMSEEAMSTLNNR